MQEVGSFQRFLISTSSVQPAGQEMVATFADSQNLTIENWLSQPDSPRTACYAMAGTPIDMASCIRLRADADMAKLDINWQFRQHPVRLLLADMDSTIITSESLDDLAEMAGIGEAVQDITRRAMAGALDFEEALNERVSMLAGQPDSLLKRLIEETQFMPGAETLLRTLKAQDVACYLVSGGFTFLTSVVAQKLGFDGHYANQMAIEDGQLAGTVIGPILGREAKLERLLERAHTHGIDLSESCCIGDGANDLAMLRAAGLGVAYQGKPLLRQEINTQLNHTDLTGLLFLQGIAERDFQ